MNGFQGGANGALPNYPHEMPFRSVLQMETIHKMEFIFSTNPHLIIMGS